MEIFWGSWHSNLGIGAKVGKDIDKRFVSLGGRGVDVLPLGSVPGAYRGRVNGTHNIPDLGYQEALKECNIATPPSTAPMADRAPIQWD